MIKGTRNDKERIVDILAKSFDDNQSVNYIVKQDKKRSQRIKKLMDYSFEICRSYGEVYLSDDKNGCALVLLPDKKKTNLQTILLDVQLAISCLGISNISKTLKRESKIKKLHSEKLKYYLWFIGVDPNQRNMGSGGALIKEIIEEAHSKQRAVYLETSTLKNTRWYEKFGFEVYHELDLGYPLFFMKKDK